MLSIFDNSVMMDELDIMSRHGSVMLIPMWRQWLGLIVLFLVMLLKQSFGQSSVLDNVEIVG